MKIFKSDFIRTLKVVAILEIFIVDVNINRGVCLYLNVTEQNLLAPVCNVSSLEFNNRDHFIEKIFKKYTNIYQSFK